MSWFGSFAHLLRDGLLRGLAVLHRAHGSGSHHVDVAPSRKRSREAAPARILQLGWIAFCSATIWKHIHLTTLEISFLLLLLAAISLWRHRTAGSEEHVGNSR
jgi:hypothetical protein